MAKQLNRFLSPLDAAFLHFEKPREPMHIGSVMIYEGHIGLDETKELLSERLHLIPRYRQRVVFPPFNVSRPLWLDDPDFDIDHHIEEVELPQPADNEVLAREAAAAYRGMLDRRRPLWKGILLRGLPGDNTAVVWKVHHAMVDGVSGVDLTMAINDLRPDAEPPPPEEPWEPASLPDPLSLLQESVQQRLSELAQGWTESAFQMLRPGEIGERLRRLNDALAASLPTSLTPLPRTPFNRPVSGRLNYAWAEFSFDVMREVKSNLGGTVNDLVLTVLAGALGRYLRAKDVRTEGVQLRAMCPVSMRRPDEHGQLGNLVSTIVAPLFVGISDPEDRLQAERQAMDKLKSARQAEAFYDLARLGERVPPLWQAMAGLVPVQQTLFNTVSTNVPGPQIPLYMKGRKLLAWLPLGIVSNNLGLFVAILSYNQRVTIGTTVDPEAVPDPWLLAGHLKESFAELCDAAGVSEPDEVPDLSERWSRPRQGGPEDKSDTAVA